MQNQFYGWDHLQQHSDWDGDTWVIGLGWGHELFFPTLCQFLVLVLAQRSVGESRTRTESPPCCSCKLQSDVMMMGLLDTVTESLGLLLSLMVWHLHAMQYRFCISIWLYSQNVTLTALLSVSDFWKKWIGLVSESWSGTNSLVGHSTLQSVYILTISEQLFLRCEYYNYKMLTLNNWVHWMLVSYCGTRPSSHPLRLPWHTQTPLDDLEVVSGELPPSLGFQRLGSA